MNATNLTMLKSGRRVVATIEPDSKWPGMWRVRSGGSNSDLVNLSRAKDAAIAIARSDLNALDRGDAPAKGADRRHCQAANSYVTRPVISAGKPSTSEQCVRASRGMECPLSKAW